MVGKITCKCGLHDWTNIQLSPGEIVSCEKCGGFTHMLSRSLDAKDAEISPLAVKEADIQFYIAALAGKEAECEALRVERDEAREYGAQARIRENEAENKRIHEHDRAEAAEATLGVMSTMFFMPDADRRQWYLSRTLEKKGFFNRSTLMKNFKVSVPQASIDIRRWLEEHPDAVVYNKSRKRYELAECETLRCREQAIADLAKATEEQRSEIARLTAECEALRVKLTKCENMHLPEATSAAILGHMNCMKAFQSIEKRYLAAEASLISEKAAMDVTQKRAIEAEARVKELEGLLELAAREREKRSALLSQLEAELERIKSFLSVFDPVWEYKVYRIEWQVRVVELDNLGRELEVHSEVAFPTLKEADEHKEKIARPLNFASGKFTGQWVPKDPNQTQLRVTSHRVEAPVSSPVGKLSRT